MTSQLTGSSADFSKLNSTGSTSPELLRSGMKQPDATKGSAQSVKFAAVLVLITLCGIVTAYFRIFNNESMVVYDDEGTLMIIIKRFLEGQVLYDRIPVFYGPLYYFYEWCAHALTGTPVSHDSVQFVSMCFWVVCALLVFVLVYRATNSLLLAVVTHFLSFSALLLIGIEPGHPQELGVTLLVVLGLVACSVSNRIILMVSLGAVAAATVATKINLGVFVVAGLTLALFAALRRGRLRSALLAAAGSAALALPVALMWGHHADWWAQKYCFVAVISLGAALLVVSREEFESPLGFSDFLFAGSGFVAFIVLIGWFAVAHGSSVHGMIDSLIVQPQQSFGKSWFRAVPVPGVALPWALVGLACAVFVATRRGTEKGASGNTVALLKLAFALGVGASCLMGRYAEVMSGASPFIWLVAVRSGSTPANRIGSLSRAILALVTVIQILYAYPVGGMQTVFTTVMMMVVAAICFSDSLLFLCDRFPRLRAPALSNIAMLPAAALVMLYVFSTGSAIRDYEGAEPLGLPGTEGMRMDHDKASLVRNLTRRIDSSPCTMLASAPGLFSFNFLTGKPAPRAVNFAVWMLMSSDAEQEKAVVELSREPYPCVLYNQKLIDFWTLGVDVSSRPLIKFIRQNFEVVFEASGYRLMEPKWTTSTRFPR
jgi:hypothetical protein